MPIEARRTDQPGAEESSVAKIPGCLPEHLSICFYAWVWLIAGRPGEGYADLDRAVRETKERGFNCIRAETGPLLAHDRMGKPRGPVRFRPWIDHELDAGVHCGEAQGHHEVDVLARLLELFRASDAYGMTVIITTWLYQDTFCQVEDPDPRAEILAVPYAARPMV